MSERIVKFRLITYFDEVPNQVTPQGENVLVERTASMGEKVDLRPADETRLDSLGALYTEDETAAIEDGSYNGPDKALLAQHRAGLRPASLISPVDGEGSGNIDEMSTEQLSDYIRENKLTVPETLALLPEDASEEQITKLYDAETAAADTDPRKGVTDALDARLAAVTQQ